jgi:two-component system response regulator AtoC
MKWLKTLVLKVAPLDSHVVIIGPSGSGKNLVADEIQKRSLRSRDPYIKIGCIGVPENVLYREIFGAEINEVEQTASDTEGKLELANNGTLLLDEIGELLQNIQARLVNALEGENSNQCTVGKSRNSYFRIIATSRLDIPSLVEEDKFREDLYFRLSRIVIHIPPLRQRLQDLPLLVDFFLPKVNQKLGTAIMAVSNDAMGVLYSYQWPGNVRELRTILERAALFGDSKILQEEQIEKAFHASVPRWNLGLDFIDERNAISTDRIHLRETLEAVEKRLIERALLKTNGVQTQAAKLLGLTAKNLWKKMQKYEIRSAKLVNFPPTAARMPVETRSCRSTTFQAEIEPDANTSQSGFLNKRSRKR